MSNENTTPGTAEEVNARFEEIMAKLRRLNTEILPLKPEAERLRPPVNRAEAFMFEAGATLDKIFAAETPDIGAAFNVLMQMEEAVDELVAAFESERGRDVGPMEAA